jgi:hypothetical protein
VNYRAERAKTNYERLGALAVDLQLLAGRLDEPSLALLTDAVQMIRETPGSFAVLDAWLTTRPEGGDAS